MKKLSRRTKSAVRNVLTVLLILSICFSTMSIEAMAEEPAVTQTDLGEGDTQPGEGEGDT